GHESALTREKASALRELEPGKGYFLAEKNATIGRQTSQELVKGRSVGVLPLRRRVHRGGRNTGGRTLLVRGGLHRHGQRMMRPRIQPAPRASRRDWRGRRRTCSSRSAWTAARSL